MIIIVSLLMVKRISWFVDMIKKLHAISVYDYVSMLCEEIGLEWPDENKSIYNGLYKYKHIEKKS